MGLNVCVFTIVEFLDSVDGEIFCFIDILTASVISLTRISFSILICEDASPGLASQTEKHSFQKQ